MRTTFSLSAMAFVLIAFASPCLAEQVNELVSAERAKELGVTFRSHINGESGVKVRIEFKPEGELKNVSRVELRMQIGEKCVVDAPLQTSQPSPEKVSAYFSADPEYLAASTVTIVVPERLGRIGYQFKVKDFIHLEKYRDVFPVK